MMITSRITPPPMYMSHLLELAARDTRSTRRTPERSRPGTLIYVGFTHAGRGVRRGRGSRPLRRSPCLRSRRDRDDLLLAVRRVGPVVIRAHEREDVTRAARV